MKLIRFGEAVREGTGVASLAEPTMEELRAKVGQTV